MTEWTIALTLMRERHRRNFVLPNYTPSKWWECDVFEVTNAGYFREYEIKTTLSDFKADSKKSDILRVGSWPNMQSIPRIKHQCMGQAEGPRQFWYVAPSGLLTPEQVPLWAGLIEIRPRKGRENHSVYWKFYELELKPAPKLHGEKLDPKVKAHAEGVCYYRLHNQWRADHLNA